MKNKNQIKQELISRYKYTYENSKYILSPYISSEIKKTYKIDLPNELLLDLESFLLSDVPFNESKLYLEMEEKKKDTDYLNKVVAGLKILKNSETDILDSKLVPNLWNLLSLVRDFINEQSADLNNKEKKLKSLDEYFRINRYSNDGKIWSSGFLMLIKDMCDSNGNISSVIRIKKYSKSPSPSRNKKDIGLKNGNFINFLSNIKNHYEDNLSILTEEEKQKIYLEYHDELPWDLKTNCEKEKDNNSTIEFVLERPNNTQPCGENFYIKEENIFMNPDDCSDKYYQLCPHCGYIVNIPSELLSIGIKNRIHERCLKNINLFRKMYLYSELSGLDKLDNSNEKKLIKNK